MTRVHGGEPRAVQQLKQKQKRMVESSTPAPMSELAGIMQALNALLTGQEASETRLRERFAQEDERYRAMEARQQALEQQTQALLNKARAVPQEVRDQATARMALDVQTQAINIAAEMKMEHASIEAQLRAEEQVLEYVPEPEKGYTIADMSIQIGTYRYRFERSGAQLMPRSIAQAVRRKARMTEVANKMSQYLMTNPDMYLAEHDMREIERIGRA